MGQIVGVENDRFTPAEVDQKEHQGAQRIEMGERVEGEPALGTGGGITQPVRGKGVGELVDGDGDDQTDQKK